MSSTFEELVLRATGHEPYPYQQRLAEEGLPDLLRVPTGGGKTMAATLPWLYRRRSHPDTDVRQTTSRWLAIVLPMRVLVEQTADVVRSWVDALGLSSEVALYTVMGGEGKVHSGWRTRPEQDAIFVGTLDMLLSRALNRGYGESRARWPFDFGLFNSGVQWVFDEVQLMGPALSTSRQIEGLRRALGTAAPCQSMWMSATVDESDLRTVDLAGVDRVVELGSDDRTGALAKRLDATKAVRRLELDLDDYAGSVARALHEGHEGGTRTIAVMNTVDRATGVYQALIKRGAPAVLLHSRFRPPDRRIHTADALGDVDPDGPGCIVVATQVIEAGVDVSSKTMFTEAASWPSIVQRSGRCNRGGETDEALLLWASPPKALPYDEEDVSAAVVALEGLEGQSVTAPGLGGLTVKTRKVVHAVLRRRDLIGLFDTTPDLGGNDIDVGRFLRDNSDLDLQVAWRQIGDDGPAHDAKAPSRDERCPVPVAQVRQALKKLDAWRFDHIDGEWVKCPESDVRPGQVLVLRSDTGGYSSEVGWDPASARIVDPIDANGSASGDESEAVGDDSMSQLRHWVGLVDHLRHVHEQVLELTRELFLPGLTSRELEAAAAAGRFHDVGKAHEVFQDSLGRLIGDDVEQRVAADSCGPPWAKSGVDRQLRHSRPHFRHELAGALALIGDASVGLEGLAEPDLAAYLVGAHHGYVRLGIRSFADETPGVDGRRVMLGVRDGDELPEVDVPGSRLPASTLDLSLMELGDSENGRPSWTARSLALVDRFGPFRLAFLEGLVMAADWRASAAEDGGET